MASLGSTIGALVRLRREQRGMSAAELARRAGISKAGLSGLEAGRGNPTIDTLDSIADALAIPLVDLLDVGTGPATVLKRAEDAGPEPISRQLLHRLGDGVETWRLRMLADASFTGVPHTPGTVEQVLLIAGGLTLGHDDDLRELRAGDLIAFAGDRPHSYRAGAAGADALVTISSPN